MNKLSAELQRLYFLPIPQEHRQPSGAGGPTAAAEHGALKLVSPDGRARALVVGFERGADWEALAKLYQGVQEDLELPAPAVSVSGKSGYRLWFSLAESVPLEEARGFLEALRREFLADLPLAHLHFRPDPGEFASAGQREGASQPGSDGGHRGAKLHVGSNFSDPQSFLLAVMNEPSASASQRIKAAKALLPYFDKRTSSN